MFEGVSAAFDISLWSLRDECERIQLINLSVLGKPGLGLVMESYASGKARSVTEDTKCKKVLEQGRLLARGAFLLRVLHMIRGPVIPCLASDVVQGNAVTATEDGRSDRSWQTSLCYTFFCSRFPASADAVPSSAIRLGSPFGRQRRCNQASTTVAKPATSSSGTSTVVISTKPTRRQK